MTGEMRVFNPELDKEMPWNLILLDASFFAYTQQCLRDLC